MLTNGVIFREKKIINKDNLNNNTFWNNNYYSY